MKNNKVLLAVVVSTVVAMNIGFQLGRFTRVPNEKYLHAVASAKAYKAALQQVTDRVIQERISDRTIDIAHLGFETNRVNSALIINAAINSQHATNDVIRIFCGAGIYNVDGNQYATP